MSRGPPPWLMITLLLAFSTAWLMTLLVLRTSRRFGHFVQDHDQSSPQKFHAHPVPRIGGVGIVAGVSAASGYLVYTQHAAELAPLLLACSLPVFLAGLLEDLTKNVSPRRRLLAAALSAGLAVWAIDGVISRAGIPGIDWLVSFQWIAALLAVFVITGFANAVNIIDGFNGLASLCVVIMLASIAYVGFTVGDSTVALLALAGIGAVLGFFFWNFPGGLVFLGDGGAYFLGFYVGELALLLVHRNPAVSPLFGLLMGIYPVFETLFSIYRKKFLRGMSPGVPDGVHLHMLIYKRLMRWATGSSDARARTQRNSLTSIYLWMLCMLSVIPAVVWWDNTAALAVFIVLFAMTYVGLYWRIVRFRTPRWLVVRR
jgi:UDP-N-acetylmuramyl pentapeptide phosphotransferase/UDP-N-acetylglucosamine-1-phosphate transferase